MPESVGQPERGQPPSSGHENSVSVRAGVHADILTMDGSKAGVNTPNVRFDQFPHVPPGPLRLRPDIPARNFPAPGGLDSLGPRGFSGGSWIQGS